jgi:hypothetical protein
MRLTVEDDARKAGRTELCGVLAERCESCGESAALLRCPQHMSFCGPRAAHFISLSHHFRALHAQDLTLQFSMSSPEAQLVLINLTEVASF